MVGVVGVLDGVVERQDGVLGWLVWRRCGLRVEVSCVARGFGGVALRLGCAGDVCARGVCTFELACQDWCGRWDGIAVRFGGGLCGCAGLVRSPMTSVARGLRSGGGWMSDIFEWLWGIFLWRELLRVTWTLSRCTCHEFAVAGELRRNLTACYVTENAEFRFAVAAVVLFGSCLAQGACRRPPPLSADTTMRYGTAGWGNSAPSGPHPLRGSHGGSAATF